MRHIIFLLFLSTTLFALSEFKCSTHEKFINAYKMISSLKNVDLTKKEIIDFSIQISSNCHNTFKRFNEIFEITEKTDLTVKSSIILAIRISLDKTIDLDNFVNIYKFLITPKGPDLPYMIALKHAEEFARKGKYAYALVKSMYNFCMEKEELNKTRKQCMMLSSKVISLGIKEDDLFEDAYNYFMENKLLNLNSNESTSMTFKILKFGKASLADFKELFSFALSKKGINLPRKQALDLSLSILKKAEFTEEAKEERKQKK